MTFYSDKTVRATNSTGELDDTHCPWNRDVDDSGDGQAHGEDEELFVDATANGENPASSIVTRIGSIATSNVLPFQRKCSRRTTMTPTYGSCTRRCRVSTLSFYRR